MFIRRTSAHNSALDIYKRFYSNECTKKYNKYKNEIEQKISLFNRLNHAHFKKEWDKVDRFIKEKNNEITDCVKNKHVSVDYYGDPDIKNFSDRCPNPSTCRNNPVTPVKKIPESKNEKKETCRGAKCKKQLASTEVVSSKSQSRITPVDPVAKSSNVHASPKQRKKHTDEEVSQAAKAVLQTKENVKPVGNSNRSELKVPEENTNHNSIISGQVQNQTQQFSGSVHPENKELRTDFNDASQNSSRGEPESLDTPQITDLDTSTLQSFPITVQDVDNETAENQDNDRVSHISKIPCPGDLTVEHLSAEYTCHKNADSTDYDEKKKDEEATFDTHPHAEDVGKDFFGKIFEVISNKDHIIQASAPMGIVMLLGLLFKYTPLWRALTKKNSKKGASINQELHSVLQEPSIMDEERSIPFSYGAFQYSSFDQNSY
ncbi:VIR protein [Plasmodium vivax]|uniref:VIR protein n=1 Tax=Plasmodium vivax TaxID=5855 RepID=A0A1G4E711_PLAVI|nr:VIR protein [Plasmodium vivax]